MKKDKPELGDRFVHDDGSTAQIVAITESGYFETDCVRPDGTTRHNRFPIGNFQNFLRVNELKGWKLDRKKGIKS